MGKTPAGIMIRTLTAADLTAVSSIDEKSFLMFGAQVCGWMS